MAEKIFIGVAWPYTNGHLHLGHLAGCYIAADVFARYHRLKGNRVLMVSGSDQHGTPITLHAEQEGVDPQVIVDRYRRSQLDTWKRLGIRFDQYTTTGTDNHREVAHDLFLALYKKGMIYPDTMHFPTASPINGSWPTGLWRALVLIVAALRRGATSASSAAGRWTRRSC